MRLPMKKAFYLLFRITSKKKGMSTVELAGEVSVQQKTAWLFKRKIQVAMQGRSINNLHIDDHLMTTSQGHIASCTADNDPIKSKEARKPGKPKMVNPDKISLKSLGFRGKPIHAILFRLWLRGIHHKCSMALFFAYCDEFYFRLRHRNARAGIFAASLTNVLQAGPHPYTVLKCSSA